MYKNGQGVSQDYGRAVELFRKAANQGNAIAQDNLGVMYQNGLGVLQDDGHAVQWFRRAANQGHAGAQRALDVMCANDHGVSQDCTDNGASVTKNTDLS